MQLCRLPHPIHAVKHLVDNQVSFQYLLSSSKNTVVSLGSYFTTVYTLHISQRASFLIINIQSQLVFQNKNDSDKILKIDHLVPGSFLHFKKQLLRKWLPRPKPEFQAKSFIRQMNLNWNMQ
jgi:hypothetical protein